MKKKKYTECENGKTEKLHEVGVDKHPSLWRGHKHRQGIMHTNA